MQLPRWVVTLIDPATGSMQRHSPPPGGPVFRGGAVFGPRVPRRLSHQHVPMLVAYLTDALEV